MARAARAGARRTSSCLTQPSGGSSGPTARWPPSRA